MFRHLFVLKSIHWLLCIPKSSEFDSDFNEPLKMYLWARMCALYFHFPYVPSVLHKFASTVQHVHMRTGRFSTTCKWMDSEHPYDVVVAVASWSVRSTPVRTVRVWGLVGDIVLCSWAGHFTLTVPALFTRVYKWVPTNLILGVTLKWTSIHSGGSKNIPSRFMLQKPAYALALMGRLARMQTCTLAIQIYPACLPWYSLNPFAYIRHSVPDLPKHLVLKLTYFERWHHLNHSHQTKPHNEPCRHNLAYK